MAEEKSITFSSQIFELKLGNERIAELEQSAEQTDDPTQKAVYLGKASSIRSEIAGKGKLSGDARKKNKCCVMQADFKTELENNPNMKRGKFQQLVDQYAIDYEYKDKNRIKRALKEVLEQFHPHLITKLLPRSK